MLANLRRVPLAGWSYTVDPTGSSTARTGSGVPTLVGAGVRCTTGCAASTRRRRTWRSTRPSPSVPAGGTSPRCPTMLRAGRVSATDLWDYGPVEVVRRPHVLVLGSPSMLGTMHQVADGLHDAIPRVSAVWGPHWPRRVVAEVPATQRELGEITGDDADVAPLAALSSAEISSAPGRPAPVGDRVSVNPRAWPSLDALGRRVVLTHELTHVASRGDTGAQTPRWLQEGFADYVGFARHRSGAHRHRGRAGRRRPRRSAAAAAARQPTVRGVLAPAGRRPTSRAGSPAG